MTVMLPERATAPAAVAPRMGTTEKLDYCRALAASGLLPAQYRQQPANLLYAVEFADSLGLHPMVAITGVHVIEGRPSASAALISALVRRAGHKLRVRGDATRADAQIVRADDPGYTFEVVFAIEDADRAGLMGKKIWKSYPAAMLKARAITGVARDACEEALFGIHYTPEELGAEVDAEGNPLPEPAPSFARQQPGADEWSQAAPARPAAEQQTPAESWDAAAEDDISGARDWITEATEAADADAVRALWREAQGAGAVPATLDAVGRIGVAKAAAEKQAREAAAEQPATAGPEGTLPGAPVSPQDRLDALAGLYAAGEAAGLSPDETRRVLADHTGKALPDATAQDIVACTADLTRAGGAR